MIKRLLEFWPVFLPTLLYLAWLFMARWRAAKKDEALPSLREGPWLWIIMTTLIVAMVCFLWLGLSAAPEKGDYQPAHIENGVIIPGGVTP